MWIKNHLEWQDLIIVSRIIFFYLVKSVFEVINTDIRAQRVLVFGSIDSCIGMAKYIRSQSPRRFVVKGFISDDANYKNNLVMGEKVYNTLDDFQKIIKKKKIVLLDLELKSQIQTIMRYISMKKK